MQDGPKAAWRIPYVSVTFFQVKKQNFIAYHSAKVSDSIFEIPQAWQSGFSRVYSNSYCSCSFEPEIMKIGQSSHKMYTNNILNFQESMIILNARTKKVWNLIVCTSYTETLLGSPTAYIAVGLLRNSRDFVITSYNIDCFVRRFHYFHDTVQWHTIADQIIMFCFCFYIWLIDLFECTLYFVNFLKIIRTLYKD